MGVSLTPRELDVMSVLWELSEATVHDVRQRLDDDLAYTSVLSVLQLLERKGYVGHGTEGRAYRYFPTVAPEAAGESVLRRALETVYRNSPVRLLANLIDADAVNGEELRRMRELLDERLEEDE